MAHKLSTSHHSLPNKPLFLPDPFEWVYIPGGEVRLRGIQHNNVRAELHTIQIESFYIAKYPITNAQYAVYRQETGYVPFGIINKWGIDSNVEKPIHPACNLRWHEAMLFCRWVSDKVNYLITLPTDTQWQRAAQGDDDRKYPWGNDWYSSYCNTEDSDIRQTTPVTQYPQGASPFGVMDMVGNIFEWCLTDPKTRTNSLDIEIPDGKIDLDKQRIFKGSCFSTSTYSSDVTKYGATPIWFPYVSGIRLITSGDPD